MSVVLSNTLPPPSSEEKLTIFTRFAQVPLAEAGVRTPDPPPGTAPGWGSGPGRTNEKCYCLLILVYWIVEVMTLQWRGQRYDKRALILGRFSQKKLKIELKDNAKNE